MPAKSSFTREMVIEAAFKIVRTKGWNKLSARAIAKELNGSTMPLYSNIRSMKELDRELREKAIDLLLTYQTTDRTGQAFFDMGLGYVLFARNERNLFRFLFEGNDPRKHNSAGKILKEFAFKNLIEKMKTDPILEGLNEQSLESVLTKMWIFTHGLAFLINNKAFVPDDETYIRRILEETGLFVIRGEKARAQRSTAAVGSPV
jgi:AcrR family transcriptional regulator